MHCKREFGALRRYAGLRKVSHDFLHSLSLALPAIKAILAPTDLLDRRFTWARLPHCSYCVLLHGRLHI